MYKLMLVVNGTIQKRIIWIDKPMQKVLSKYRQKSPIEHMLDEYILHGHKIDGTVMFIPLN